MRLGPPGFPFEQYVSAILTAYGYDASLPQELQGACVKHEVDVVAKKEGRAAFIEAKFRQEFSGSVEIKDALATWARFLDLVDGSKINLCPHFDEAWIVTNARFTPMVLQYGHCKNMMLIGWNHPRERTFAQMVDHEALYPITIIPGLQREELAAFGKAGMLLCKEVAGSTIVDLQKKVGLPVKRLEQISKICLPIVSSS